MRLGLSIYGLINGLLGLVYVALFGEASAFTRRLLIKQVEGLGFIGFRVSGLRLVTSQGVLRTSCKYRAPV